MGRTRVTVGIAAVVILAAPGICHAAPFGASTRLGVEGSWGLNVAAGAAGDAAVVWQTSSGLHVARHEAGADPSQWRTEVLASAKVRGTPAVVVTPSGTTVVAFEPDARGGGAPVTVASGARGKPFRSPIRMSDPSRYRTWPALAVLSSGGVGLAFTQRTQLQRGALRVAVWSATASRFSPPRTVGRAAEPAVMVPADAGAILTWRTVPHTSRGSRGYRRDLLALRLDRLGRPAGDRSVLSRSAGFWNVSAGSPTGPAIAAWSWTSPGQSGDRMLACRLIGTPVRCAGQRAFEPLWSARDVPSVAVGRTAAAIGFAIAPSGGGAQPAFAMLSVAGGWSPRRTLPGAPAGSSTRLVLIPGAEGGFDALTARSVSLFRVAPARATGPVQTLGATDEPSSVAAAGDGRTAVVAWTGPGSGGFAGPVEVSVRGPA